MKKSITFLVLLTVLAPVDAWAKKKITICADDNWFPYTFVKDGAAVGIHVDIVRRAIKEIGLGAEITPLPWRRCLLAGETGIFDAVVSASYKDERAAFAHYPEDAATAVESESRITQVKQVLVTRSSDPFQFSGDWKTIPEPVGVFGLGSSITAALKKKGVEVFEAIDKTGGVRMLLKERIASITLNHFQAKHFQNTTEFKGRLNVQKVPLTSKSYHIIFSRKGGANEADRKAIWSSLSKVRKDGKYVQDLADTYEKYD